MSRIVIVGGGVIGSSIAYHLARAGVAADVTVIEPDPTYEFAATPRAVGGVRLLHGLAENVVMSLHGLDVYTNFQAHVQGAKVEFDPAFHRQGYLYMVWGAAAVAALEDDARMQRRLGVDVAILDRAELAHRYPSFDFSPIDAAAFSAADGQIDPNAALMGFRRAAEALGVTYVKDRVVGIELAGSRVTAVDLKSGSRLSAEIVVNAANCWAPEICAMVGMRVPIEPMRRQQFYFLTQSLIEPIPVMREMSGFAIRPEREGYLVAATKFDEKSGFDWTLDYELFDDVLWPKLVERSTAFEAVKLQSGWVGHYDMNRMDGNPIIGPFEGQADNFILVAGFSGHGLQHAPAVGRGVKELILEGGFFSIDLSAFSYRRVAENRPLLDRGPRA